MDNRYNYLLTLGQDSFLPLSRFLPHQLEVLQKDNHRFKVLVWHRRARKTTTAIAEVVKQSQLRIGAYWHLFPTYAEAKDAVWRDPQMLFNMIPEKLVERTNESELIVYFKNGSMYQLKGADDPDALRGAGPVGLILDEFAMMKYESWQVLEPILRANGGWAWFIGTPKGRNHLYDFYIRGQKGDPEWKSWILRASTSGVIHPEQLLKSKQTQPQAMYNQEYECEFLEGAGQVFRGVRDVCTAVPKPPETNHLYVMGVDLAKVTDYTVIAVYDRATNAQVYQDRFQTLEWPFQKEKIKAIAEKYNKALVVLDATGVGDPIADDLARFGVNVEPFKISEISKKELIEKLSIWIDQRRIRMFNSEAILYEFDNFSYEIGSTGKIRYGAKEGYHDDIVMAHALAVWSLQPIIPPVREIPYSPIKQRLLRLTKQNEREDSWDYLPEEV